MEKSFKYIKRKNRLISLKKGIIKRYRKIYGIKKIKENKSKFKIKLFKLLMLFILMTINIFINNDEYNNNKNNKNKNIIESQNYENFNIMKDRYKSEFSSIFDKIDIILYIRNYNLNELKKDKTNINIVVSFNSKYTYILMVSMNSVLLNINKDKSFITYHLLCSPDVNSNNITHLKSFMDDYYNNLEMIFYNMTTLAETRKNCYLSKTTYFRVYSPIFINSDRMIYLDGDTLTFDDLGEMYNLNFKDNYILGFFDVLSDEIDYLGIRSERYINAGVTLFNLKKIREDRIINKIIDSINDITLNLHKDDQTLVNYLLYPKIGRLPLKYGIFNFEGKSDFGPYLSRIRTKIDANDLENGLNNAVIIHNVLCVPKIWYPNPVYYEQHTYCRKRDNCSCMKYHNLWHSFANKTKYYNEILLYLGIKK